jgi:hypothetical protein
LVKVLESENEDEDENDLWTDARENTTFIRLAYIIKVLEGKDVSTEVLRSTKN